MDRQVHRLESRHGAALEDRTEDTTQIVEWILLTSSIFAKFRIRSW
jgi:hypothetical protein